MTYQYNSFLSTVKRVTQLQYGDTVCAIYYCPCVSECCPGVFKYHATVKGFVTSRNYPEHGFYLESKWKGFIKRWTIPWQDILHVHLRNGKKYSLPFVPIKLEEQPKRNYYAMKRTIFKKMNKYMELRTNDTVCFKLTQPRVKECDIKIHIIHAMAIGKVLIKYSENSTDYRGYCLEAHVGNSFKRWNVHWKNIEHVHYHHVIKTSPYEELSHDMKSPPKYKLPDFTQEQVEIQELFDECLPGE